MRSQEKLSQVRRLASAGSRAVQEGTSVSRAPSNLRNVGLLPLLIPLQPLSRFLQGTEVQLPKGAGLKIGEATEGLAGPRLSLQLSRGSPTRGLQLGVVDSSIPSLPPIPPTLGEGVDGSTFLDIPGLVWDTQLGIAQKGLFSVGSRLSFFLPAWQRITSDKFVLEVIRQGYMYSLPFVRPPLLSLSPVETLLPRLQCKRLALWEKVSSLTNQEGRGHWSTSLGTRGDFIPIISWPPSTLVSSAPSSTYTDSTHLYKLPSSIWKPSHLFCRVFTKVGGWCC